MFYSDGKYYAKIIGNNYAVHTAYRIQLLSIIVEIALSFILFQPSAQAQDIYGAESLLVLPLESRSAYNSHDWIRTGFSEVLEVKLLGTARLKVIELETVVTTLKAHERSIPDLLTRDLALQIARDVSADWVLWGAFDKRINELELEIQLHRVSDGSQQAAQSFSVPYEEPWTGFTQIAQLVISTLKRIPDAHQETVLLAKAARDRYSLTLYGRGINQLFGISTLQDTDRAFENLLRASRIDPENPMMHYAIGQAESMRLESGKAAAAFYEALKYRPDYSPAHRQMVNLRLEQGRTTDALYHLNAILDVEPWDLVSRFSRSQLLVGGRSSREALEDVSIVAARALDHDLKRSALLLQAQLRAQLGDLPGMAQSYQQLLELDPSHRVGRLGLASYHFRTKSFDEAKQHFSALAISDPADPVPPHFLGEIGLAQGNFDAAIAALRVEGAIRPSHPAAWSYLGEVYRRNGNLPKVVEAEGMAEVRSPNDPIPLNNLAIARAQEGDLPTAIKLLKEAVALAPGWGLLRQNLGLVLAQMGLYDQAHLELQLAVELNPDLARAHYQLGLLFARDANLEAAKKAFAAAALADKTMSAADFNLGCVLEMLGDKAGAIKAYQSYLDKSPGAADAAEVRKKVASRGS